MKNFKDIVQKYYFLTGEQNSRNNKLSYTFANKNSNALTFDVETKIVGDVCFCAEKLQMEYFEFKDNFENADWCITDKVTTAAGAVLNNLKCVYIAEKEDIKKLYLPVLTANDKDIEIIPPICCVLHKTGANELVPIYSRQNLLDAILGHVYPYWSLEIL